jgi:D-3-phosphoglycerate dehydrogenase / 2-oxoglutarate reductase
VRDLLNLRVALLDQYHPDIYAAIKCALPKEWTACFAKSRALADQIAAVAVADLLFVMAAPVTAEILSASARLRLIQKLGAGVDRIDRKACAEKGIAVARLAGVNSIPVAEHTLLLILAALRRLPLMDRRTRAGEWLKEEARGVSRQLHGKQIGLVGLGAVGKALVKLLAGFDIKIVYYDPVVASAELERQIPIQYMPLEELLATSDIVSLHLPLLPETTGLISEQRIARMKLGAVLINCARGGLVDEVALARALVEKRLFAAGLDAFAQEPPIDSPLLALDETVVTPHMAGATIDNFVFVIERAVRNASQYLTGHGLPEQDAVFVPQGARTDPQ